MFGKQTFINEIWNCAILPYLNLHEGYNLALCNKFLYNTLWKNNTSLFVLWILKPMMLTLFSQKEVRLPQIPQIPSIQASKNVDRQSFLWFVKIKELSKSRKESSNERLLQELASFNDAIHKKTMVSKLKTCFPPSMVKIMTRKKRINPNFLKIFRNFYQKPLFVPLYQCQSRFEWARKFALGAFGYEKNVELLPQYLQRFCHAFADRDPRVSHEMVQTFCRLKNHRSPWYSLDGCYDLEEDDLAPLAKLPKYVKDQNNLCIEWLHFLKQQVRHRLHSPCEKLFYPNAVRLFAKNFGNVDWCKPVVLYLKNLSFRLQPKSVRLEDMTVFYNRQKNYLSFSRGREQAAFAFLNDAGALYTVRNFLKKKKNLTFLMFLKWLDCQTDLQKSLKKLGQCMSSCAMCGKKMSSKRKKGIGTKCQETFFPEKKIKF
jgi:hypothetical protein